MLAQSLIGAAVLAAVHLFASKLRFLDVIPRSRWLSIAGGVAVAYVVVHLLPELQEHQEALVRTAENLGIAFARKHLVWVLTLGGLVIFYGLEKGGKDSKVASRR